MIIKSPKSKFLKYVKKGAIVVFVAEAFSFAACYACYFKLNTERDFRLYMRDNFPPILELYYKVGETFGDNKARQKDNEIWHFTQPSRK